MSPAAGRAESQLGENIFSDQQEIDLGDAMAESLAQHVKIIHGEHLRVSQWIACPGTESNQLSIYELNTSQLRQQFTFSDPVSFQAFSRDGSRLFVMTVSQTVYVLDLNAKN